MKRTITIDGEQWGADRYMRELYQAGKMAAKVFATHYGMGCGFDDNGVLVTSSGTPVPVLEGGKLDAPP